jgi:hypothetical protein
MYQAAFQSPADPYASHTSPQVQTASNMQGNRNEAGFMDNERQYAQQTQQRVNAANLAAAQQAGNAAASHFTIAHGAQYVTGLDQLAQMQNDQRNGMYQTAFNNYMSQNAQQLPTGPDGQTQMINQINARRQQQYHPQYNPQAPAPATNASGFPNAFHSTMRDL